MHEGRVSARGKSAQGPGSNRVVDVELAAQGAARSVKSVEALTDEAIHLVGVDLNVALGSHHLRVCDPVDAEPKQSLARVAVSDESESVSVDDPLDTENTNSVLAAACREVSETQDAALPTRVFHER